MTNPCRAMHPTHRGVYCEGTAGHDGDHHNLTDKALPVRAQRWPQAPTRIPAALLEEPDAHRRPPRLKVNLRCIAGQHDTCPGHTYGATSLCGCPDASHDALMAKIAVEDLTDTVGTPWATSSGADIAGDIAAAKAAVEAADDGIRFDVMPPGPEMPVELTAVEVKLITAAHLELRPTSALEAVRRILTDRLAQ